MEESSFIRRGQSRRKRRDLTAFTHALGGALGHALDAEDMADRSGWLQGLDPRFKLLALLALILSALIARSLTALAALLCLSVLLAWVSNIGLARLAGQVWIAVLLCTGMIALPSLVLVPGEALVRLPLLDWTLTLQGLRSALFLIGRAEISATFCLLLILTTPWTQVLKALRSVGAPLVLVAVLGMTHRHIFVLLESAVEMLEARRSRSVGPMRPADRRRVAIATAGALLAKAFQLSNEVHLAMVSRGYRGEVRLLDDFRSRPRDWMALAAALAVPAIILRVGW